jgi:galactosyl transferase GMA12/MNN10 family
MNPQISLDIFIPPSPEFDYVNLLKTHDRHGLNNGVFLIKINDWSVKLLTAVLAFHHFRPAVELKYSEQSALDEILKGVGRNFFIQQSPNARNMLLIIALEIDA